MPIQSLSRRLLPVIASVFLLTVTEPCRVQARAGDVLPVRVVDSAGTPVKGAIIAGRLRLHDPIHSLGFSDDEGACSVKLPADAQHLKLFARAEGYGLVDHSVSLKGQSDGESVQVRLRPAASISGRLVDEQGKPAGGVRVRPYKIVKFEGGRSLQEAIAEAEWIRGLERDGWPVIEVKASSDLLLPWVETDQEGRFTIDSVAPDQLAGLLAIGERSAATTIIVRTDDGPASSVGTQRGDPNITVHPREGFQQTVATSVPIVGRVSEVGFGRPVIGATVSPWRAPAFGFNRAEELMAAQTGVSGRYELLGMPAGSWRIFAAPPKGQKMVAVERRIEIKPDDFVATVDYKMPQGVTVTGSVTDRNSGEPVPGTVSFYVFSDNPNLEQLKPSSISVDRHSTSVDEQGRFEIQVLPGPGILTFRASTSVPQNYRRGIGWDQIDHHVYQLNGNHTMFRTEPSLIAYNCTQLYEVNIPDTNEVHERDLVVGERRTDVPLHFTGPAGKRLPSSIYYSNATPDEYSFRLWAPHSSRTAWQEAVISFFADGKPRVVQAVDSQHELAGWTWVQPDDESATIELKPAASVRGRVVREDGSPVAGAAIHTPYAYDPTEKAGVLPSQPEQGYYSHTDDAGRFEFIGLAPNLPLTVMIDQEDDALNRLLARHYLLEHLQLKPGETRDLGNLRIDKLRKLKPE